MSRQAASVAALPRLSIAANTSARAALDRTMFTHRLLCGLLAKKLRCDLIGLDRGWNATIHRNKQQQVLHLLARAAIGQRALGMDPEFGRPVAGGSDREHHEAPLRSREA